MEQLSSTKFCAMMMDSFHSGADFVMVVTVSSWWNSSVPLSAPRQGEGRCGDFEGFGSRLLRWNLRMVDIYEERMYTASVVERSVRFEVFRRRRRHDRIQCFLRICGVRVRRITKSLSRKNKSAMVWIHR
jgi:hypothetical protein